MTASDTQGNLTEIFGPVIDSYTRADMVHDGFLVEVPRSVSDEAGITCTVALTRAAWDDCVAWDTEDTTRKGVPQDEDGRLWDVLWMTRHAIARSRGRREAPVLLYRIPRRGPIVEPVPTTLVAVAGPGDSGELVITIKLPGEQD